MFGSKWLKGLGTGLTVVAVAIAAFFIGLLVVKLVWAWIVKDLFPGAVEQGLVADEISWGTSFKVALVVALLSIFWGRSVGKAEKRKKKRKR